MKILIVSDLHSNVEGIKAIWEKESDAERIYASGDFVDYGTDPIATIDWVKSHHVQAVYGNHDQKVREMWHQDAYHDMPPEKYTWAHHNCERLDAAHAAFLDKLPEHRSFVVDGVEYLMTHRYGKKYEIIESLYHFDKYWEENFSLPHTPGAKRRMIFGHSHRQQLMYFAPDALWLNPGSASYRRPDEPSKDAFYAVIEDGRIEFRHTPYNRQPLYDEAVRVRPCMMPVEWTVADFFFGWKEEDGPDTAWLKFLATAPKLDLGNKT